MSPRVDSALAVPWLTATWKGEDEADWHEATGASSMRLTGRRPEDR